MAFAFQYLARLEATQQYDKTINVPSGCAANAIPTAWIYNAGAAAANATAAATQAANYFSTAFGYLSVGDIIYVYSNDPGYHILNVATSSSAGVTTAQIV
jgi:hypothetical protein